MRQHPPGHLQRPQIELEDYLSSLDSSEHDDTRTMSVPQNIVLGGEPNEKNQLFGQPQVNSIVIPIYKNGEKRIFDHWVHLNPPHLTSKLLILGHFLHFSPLSVRVF